jgi:hypothetical protein
MKREWLQNPASTDLFTEYRKNAPNLWPQGTSTHQGFYCMTADGDFLSGTFARASNEKARKTIAAGWKQFETLAENRNWSPKPIPTNRFELTQGEAVQPGGIKLKIASRDLPRGNDERPGKSQSERDAYNVNWIDFSTAEASHFVSTTESPTAVPRAILEKLAMNTIKDNVRGQTGWKKGSFQDGQLHVRMLSTTETTRTMQVEGFAILNQPGHSIAAQIYGQIEFDTRQGEFTRFDLAVAGQRQGGTPANFRRNDPGPAPIGIAYKLYRPKQLHPKATNNKAP